MNKADLLALISASINAEEEEHRALLTASEEGSLTGSLDAYYLLYAGALVFLMQAGFAMLCAGSLRMKNIKNIMLKNVLDACVGALGFWACGYAFSYGNKNGTDDWTLIGDTYFALYGGFEDDNVGYHNWFFQFAFAATAATIVSGAVAERCQMTAYALYSAVLTAFVYPVVVHHFWSSNGYFSAFRADPLFGI